MRKAEGYLAVDGTFFDIAADCEWYEANHALDFHARSIGVNPDKLRIAVDGLGTHIRRYLDAKDAFQKSETEKGYADGGKWERRASEAADGFGSIDLGHVEARVVADAIRTGRATPPDIDHSDHDRAESYTSSVFEQSIDGAEHVSDVGSGVTTEAVSDKGTVDGIGVRRPYARDIRRDTYMATTSTAALTGPRGSDGTPLIREPKVRA